MKTQSRISVSPSLIHKALWDETLVYHCVLHSYHSCPTFTFSKHSGLVDVSRTQQVHWKLRAFRLIDCSVWNRFCLIFPWLTIIQLSVLILMPPPPKSLPLSLHLTFLIGLLTHFLIILVFFHLFYLLYEKVLFVTCLFVPFH